MALPKQKIAARPHSADKLSDIVEKLLREADAIGVLPTPVDRLFTIAKVTNVDDLPDASFFATLSEKTRSIFARARQKLRGIADLREKVTYIPRDANTTREFFAKCHELGHQTIPWHKLETAYLDNAESFTPYAKAIFEQEANHFSAQAIFQVDRFRTIARDYRPSFDAIFALAERHGASKHATAWRFVEEQDEALALLFYYPSGAVDSQGNVVFTLWRSVGSPKFDARIAEIDIPLMLHSGHPWLSAYDENRVCDGNESLIANGHPMLFQWHAWWNSYTLLVLLRRRPALHLVGQVFDNW